MTRRASAYLLAQGTRRRTNCGWREDYRDCGHTIPTINSVRQFKAYTLCCIRPGGLRCYRCAPRSSPMPEKPSVTLPGGVEQIIESPHPDLPEKAQIAVEGADDLYQEIRIDNTSTDNKGKEVRLKEGAQVEVTVEAEAGQTTSKPAEAKKE